MKLASTIILLTFATLGIPSLASSQSFTIDSSKKSMDITGDFNGAAIHLPAVKKRPEFPGGKEGWQNLLRTNINIKVPFANKAVPGIYEVMIRFIVGSDGKLWGIGADSNCGFGMETEVIRCFKKSVDWIPAETESGKKVTYTLRTMVVFTVKQKDVTISFP